MARRKDESLINNRKQKKARKVMFAVAFLLTLLCIGTGSYVQQLDTVQVGSVAEKRYVAEADAVDEVATNKLKDAAADSVAPIYKQDAAVEEGSNAEVKELFQDLEQILANLKQGESFVEKAQEAPWKLPVVLSERELKAYQALGKSNRTLSGGLPGHDEQSLYRGHYRRCAGGGQAEGKRSLCGNGME